MAKLETESFDLVVLDWMLPDCEGIEVLRQVRQQGEDVPVLILTARTAPSDRSRALASGADDYLPKPFAFAELLARCRALVRRPRSMSGRFLSFDDLQLDIRARTVKRAGRVVQLTPREVDLLEYFMRFQGQTVTSEMLERDVWKQTTRTGSLDNVIKVQVAQLRRKVDQEGLGRLIHTVRGIGYRLARES